MSVIILIFLVDTPREYWSKYLHWKVKPAERFKCLIFLWNLVIVFACWQRVCCDNKSFCVVQNLVILLWFCFENRLANRWQWVIVWTIFKVSNHNPGLLMTWRGRSSSLHNENNFSAQVFTWALFGVIKCFLFESKWTNFNNNKYATWLLLMLSLVTMWSNAWLVWFHCPIIPYLWLSAFPVAHFVLIIINDFWWMLIDKTWITNQTCEI